MSATSISDEKVAAPESVSSAVHRNLSSPWASFTVIVITILWTIPTLGLFVTSLRPSDKANQNGWWNAFIDHTFTASNYSEVLTGGAVIPQGIANFFINSLVITIPAVLIPLAIATMAAYALAWIPFRGATFLFVTCFALQVVPLQMALLPLLQLFNKGWKVNGVSIIPPIGGHGTYYQLWIAHAMFALPLAIFLIHNFMSQIPKDLMEAAVMDGAGHFRIFRTIVLPLSVPAIASFAIFQFLWVWNDLLVALTFAGGNDQVAPMTVYLSNIKGTYGSALHLVTAGAFVSILMPLIVFFALQRFFVRGLLAGSVKG